MLDQQGSISYSILARFLSDEAKPTGMADPAEDIRDRSPAGRNKLLAEHPRPGKNDGPDQKEGTDKNDGPQNKKWTVAHPED